MERGSILIVSLLFTASLGAGLVYNESSYRSTVQNLEGQIDLIQDQWEEDNETSEGISEENRILLEAKGNLESQIGFLSTQIEVEEALRQELISNLSETRALMESLNQTIASSEEERVSLQAQIQSLNQLVSSLESDLNSKEGEISDLQGDLEVLQSTLTALQITVSSPMFQLGDKIGSCPQGLPGQEWQLGYDNGAGSASIDGILSSDEIIHREGLCDGPVGMVKDINSGIGSSSPRDPVVMGGVAYFAADDGIHGEELWRSDGTFGGTYMVKDINPESRVVNVIQGTTEPDDSDISELTVAGDKIFFFARNGSMMPYTDSELWVSDGTEGGTKQVLVNGMFYQTLTQTVPFIGQNLDWYNGPRELVAVGDRVFFSSMAAYWNSNEDWEASGEELWVSDGTEFGTRMVENIHPDTESGQSGGIMVCCADWTGSSPRSLTLAGENLYFTADNGQHGRELWKVDTDVPFFNYDAVRIRDINPGPFGSDASSLTAAGDRLYFSANDGANGYELWTTMGTTATTVMVEDLIQNGSSSPNRLVWGGNNLFFTSEVDGDEGRELLMLNEDPQTSTFDPEVTFLSNDTIDPRPLSLSGGSMYFREAGNGLDQLLYWDPDMGFGTVQTPIWAGWENLTVVSDNHLAVAISWDVMFDGTYLNNLHPIGNHEALYVIVAPPDIQNELNGVDPLLTGNMVAEIQHGTAIILGPGDSWYGCMDYLNLYPEDLDLPEYANLCLDWTVDDSMSMTLLDQHVLISGETPYAIGSSGVDLVSIYLPNMHASEPYRCPVGPVATSCV
mgnify:CR=1 FL=1